MNPMTVAQLFALLAKMALVEIPRLHDGSEKNQKYLDGMQNMTRIYLEVGAQGALISSDADPLLLAAIGYEESRHRPDVKDGDCHFIDPGPPHQACNSVGPMQLNTGTPRMLAEIDAKWQGYTTETLRNPQTNVEAAYRMLAYYKAACKGGPAIWLGAWSAGHCSQHPHAMGYRRCAMAKALGDASGIAVEGCDMQHGMTPHIRSLVKALKKGN